MTTYSAVASTEIDADSPITDALLAKLANNPTAITEGASGAPRVTAAALNTATNTLTGTVAPGTTAIRTIGGFAFAISCNGANLTFAPANDSTGPDNARMLVSNGSGATQSYTLYWRAMI